MFLQVLFLSLRDNYTLSLFIFEFDKNANSYCEQHRLVLALSVGLATIGVCVFCAFTSVGALFILRRIYMKKIGCWLYALVVILCCLLCCSCGEKEPKNEDLEEYYEIEYKDGSGVHTVKAIFLQKILEIKIFETYMEGNVEYLKEWEI